jgi:hypothetical protein
MKPIILILILICLSCAANAHDHSADICPTLPPDSQLKWNHNQGLDFDVCRAMRGENKVFGVYACWRQSLFLEKIGGVSPIVINLYAVGGVRNRSR